MNVEGIIEREDGAWDVKSWATITRQGRVPWAGASSARVLLGRPAGSRRHVVALVAPGGGRPSVMYGPASYADARTVFESFTAAGASARWLFVHGFGADF